MASIPCAKPVRHDTALLNGGEEGEEPRPKSNGSQRTHCAARIRCVKYSVTEGAGCRYPWHGRLNVTFSGARLGDEYSLVKTLSRIIEVASTRRRGILGKGSYRYYRGRGSGGGGMDPPRPGDSR